MENPKIDNFQLRADLIGINSTNLKDFFTQTGVDLKLQPEKAAEAQQSGSVLFVGTLNSPWVSRNKPEPSPLKIDSSNSVIQKAQIYLKITEIWLYNTQTGEIYSKFKE